MSAPASSAPSREAHHIPYTITLRTLTGIEVQVDAIESNTINDIMLAIFNFKKGPSALGWGKKEQNLIYRQFRDIEFGSSDKIPSEMDSMKLLDFRLDNGRVRATYYKDFPLKVLDPSISIFTALEVLAQKRIQAKDRLCFRLCYRLPDIIKRIEKAHQDLFGTYNFTTDAQRIVFKMLINQKKDLLKEYREKFDYETERGFKEFEEKAAAHIDDLGDFNNLFPKESRKPSKSEVKR